MLGRMTDAPTLSVQSVLYGTEPSTVAHVAASVANSSSWALDAGVISAWQFAVGDSSPVPSLSAAEVDDIAEACALAGGAFSYEFFDANLGHGGGHNQLSTHSATDLLLFLNPDALLAPDTLTELVLSLGDGVGATDGRQVPLEHPKNFAEGSGDESWASGACLLTRRSVFDAIGGFDTETFFMYCDDVDYSWRVKLAGHRVVYSPAARVFHDKRLDLTGSYHPGDAEIYYSAEAAILLAHKYSNPRRVRSLLTRFRAEGSAPALKAAFEFEARRSAGTLPTPIDTDHRVAQFVGDNYAEHRF
jgi:GT2 family glycosyltransferase